jgi:transcriptional regulator with XRE-family HTH domain
MVDDDTGGGPGDGTGGGAGGGAIPGEQRLGEFIRMQRRLADLSLRRMSELTKVSNAYLSQVERGLHQPSVRVLRSIADALDISAETLLAQAGLLDPQRAEPVGGGSVDDGAGRTGNRTEAAILSDPSLAPEDRAALIRVYRSLRKPPVV